MTKNILQQTIIVGNKNKSYLQNPTKHVGKNSTIVKNRTEISTKPKQDENGPKSSKKKKTTTPNHSILPAGSHYVINLWFIWNIERLPGTIPLVAEWSERMTLE